jgi:hypothetical protein
MKKLLLALVFSQVFISCEKSDDNDETEQPYLHFYESKISIPPFISGSADFVVESNTDWELSVTTGADWLLLSKKSGHGTDTIHVDVIGQNVGSQVRTAIVTAKVTNPALNLQVQLTVEQKPYTLQVLSKMRLVGTLSNYFNAIAPGLDGGYLAVGSNNFTGFPGVGFGDAWMVKLNKSGDTVWTRTMGKASMDDVAKAAIPTSDGGFIVAAETIGNNSGIPGSNDGTFDWWLIKLKSNGDTAWTRLVGTDKAEYVNSIVPASNGNFIVAGSRHIPSGSALVARFDQNGNKIWEKNFVGFGESSASSVSVSPDGSIYVAASANNNTQNYDYRIIKLDANGEQIWNKGLGSGSPDYPESIQSTVDGGCIVVGSTYGSGNGDVTGQNHGGTDLWVMKLNASGDVTWNKLLGGSGFDGYYRNAGIGLTLDGGYVLAANTGSTDGDVGPGNSRGGVWALKLSNGGQLLWSRVFGSADDGDSRSFTMGNDGSFWVAGAIASSGGTTDGWFMNFKVN